MNSTAAAVAAVSQPPPSPIITGNVTAPPENYRFIPGSTSTYRNLTGTTLRPPISNRTAGGAGGIGNYIDDETEPGLNDLQTLLLACFATLILLIVTLLTAFGIRMLWRRYKMRECRDYDGVLPGEESTEPLSRPLHSHLLNSDKMKCGDTHISIGTEDVEVCDETGTINSGSMRGNNHSSTNGSIITMTLKNNHLIVETEERNDIEEDSRETTMKYSPSARDGVFVVEVQQGVRRSPGTGAKAAGTEGSKPVASSLSDQCALVHNPPDRFSDEDTLEESDEKYYVETTSPSRGTPDSLMARIRTGFSQSDLSLSSNGPSYCYGNQQGYDSGNYGYPSYNGYINDDPPPPPVRPPENILKTKPKITSAVYKNRSTSKQASIDILTDGPLMSDVQARERAVARKDEYDSIQEEQNRLGNSMPPGGQEPIMNQIKQLLAADNNKFEKLNNDVSPTAETDVKTVQYENKGFESNDLSKC